MECHSNRSRDQVEDLDSLRKKELHWINRLNTWATNGLNTTEVYEAYKFKKLRFYIHIPVRTFFKSDIAVTELKIF